MAEVKWIKIVTDIFDDGKMLAIESMPDGRDIELIWFKILCLAGKCNCNGFLMISDKIAYTDEMLSKIFRTEIGVVQRALETFQALNMIEIVDNTYMVSNWNIHQSSDRLEEIQNNNRERQQRYRDRQKQAKLEDKEKCNVTHNVKNNVSSSYSYSNNTNINNLIYILENISNEYTEYINNNPLLKETIEDWMKYKDERKPKSSNRYSETSLNSLLKKIVKCCYAHGSNVVDRVIQDSIANNYQGIVWDWLKKDSKASFTVPRPKKPYENADGSIDWSKV